MIDPTSKKGVRSDPKEGLIFVPGRDEPQELLAPLTEKRDPRTQLPYQSVMSQTEMMAMQEQIQRCNNFIHSALAVNWKCLSCGRIGKGTELNPSQEMLNVLRELLPAGGARMDWDSMTEALAKHLRCPVCKGGCFPVREEK